ncbi:hypothetical protein GCM10023339_78590 [Alloalcanivorax gelatiniphagus]|uniref:Helix-turn-helix domain-containing protein n=1 Tax=Alloalcanivorax gelatiniphagus TaxID=1194167 RepID=A0ABY2XMW8_9GAMM|nr:hypothetical protein FGS76_06365 [Alloalcanivorax gelatiniphagus]
MALSRVKAKSRRAAGSFAALPHIVMESGDFRCLSGSAMKVLMCLLRQYTGKNNGDLSASYTQVKAWGIGSKSTLTRALEELQERNLIQQTREGRFLNPGGRCALYALTWQAIDDCDGKLDVGGTNVPPRKFTLGQAKNPVQKPYPERTESVPKGGH